MRHKKQKGPSCFGALRKAIGGRRSYRRTHNPSSFVTEQQGAEEEEEESTSGTEDRAGGSETEEEDQDSRERRKQEWLRLLQEDLGVKVIEPQDLDGEEPSTSEEQESGDTSSSHEVGVEAVSSDSEEAGGATQDEDEREFEDDLPRKKKKTLNKQMRRKLGHSVHEIAVSFNQEEGEQKGAPRHEGDLHSEEGEASAQQVVCAGGVHLDVRYFSGCRSSAMAFPRAGDSASVGLDETSGL